MKLGVLGYIKYKGKTLMLFRNKKKNDMHEGKWTGLGGKIEAGESPEEALHREVFEESGLKIFQPKLKGIITFPQFSNNDDWYVFLFVMNRFKGKILNCPEGELHWISDNKIKNLNLWEGDHLFFQWLKHDNFFSAKLIYEGEKVKHSQINFY